ncbi:MAG: hypothetical protein ACOY7U_06140 [Acidobacteriota bacterium]|jgi:hypothetical protein|uniref:EamA family transporter n=1 Tax=Thermoanaerobaculum aquaticum TaxID=1312852 RepID=A0A062XUZ9_9BACT|nr:hypothetical protein [Thermoanaerobaculum aquaticum]KDA53224.1 hypothetical protein EG19_06980 [Thermoanaerobaculum aquaticum]BCW93578.1 MAG: hypothetical protein KatS3mg007_1472 [Thermoanaerobaculum sp.]
MRNLILALIILAALAFVVGTVAAFGQITVLGKPPVTFWRGAVGFLLFAIALELWPGAKA